MSSELHEMKLVSYEYWNNLRFSFLSGILDPLFFCILEWQMKTWHFECNTVGRKDSSLVYHLFPKVLLWTCVCYFVLGSMSPDIYFPKVNKLLGIVSTYLIKCLFLIKAEYERWVTFFIQALIKSWMVKSCHIYVLGLWPTPLVK